MRAWLRCVVEGMTGPDSLAAMVELNICDAETHLSRLLDRDAAGEEILAAAYCRLAGCR